MPSEDTKEVQLELTRGSRIARDGSGEFPALFIRSTNESICLRDSNYPSSFGMSECCCALTHRATNYGAVLAIGFLVLIGGDFSNSLTSLEDLGNFIRM